MSHELESWTRIGVTMWAQSGIVLLLGWMAAKALSRRGLVAQMMVLRAALAGVAVVAVLSLVSAGRVRSAWRVQLPLLSSQENVAQTDATNRDAPKSDEATSPAISSTNALSSAESSTRLSASTSPEEAKAKAARTRNAPQSARVANSQWLGVYQAAAIVWACGSLALLSWLLFCSVRIAALRRQSAVVTSGLWHRMLSELCAQGKLRQPILLQSKQARSPFLVGLWRPAIVLPVDELILEATAAHAVLLHELTHWRRRDLWWNLAARIIGIVLWPQPLLWIVSREIERVSEEVCDLSVVQNGCAASDYARCLLDLSERLTLHPIERTVAAGVVPRQSALGHRVKRILENRGRQEMTVSHRVRVATGLLTLGAIGLSVSLVSVEARPEIAAMQSSTRQVASLPKTTIYRRVAGAAPIRGRVVYPDGRPAAGVRVMLQIEDKMYSSKAYQAWSKPRQEAMMRLMRQTGGKLTPEVKEKFLALSEKWGDMAMTAQDGTYQLAGFPLARHNISVSFNADLFKTQTTLPDWVATAAQIRTPLERTTELVNDIVLTKGAIIQGRVLDRATRQPLPNVFVACHGPQNPRSGAAVTATFTDAQGRYAMRVAPGTSYVYIGGGSQLKATVHFEDSPPYVKDLDVIKAGQSFYATSAWARVQLDNGAPKLQRVGPSGNLFAVPTTLGQTRTLDFLLDKLETKRLADGLHAYIPAKPRGG